MEYERNYILCIYYDQKVLDDKLKCPKESMTFQNSFMEYSEGKKKKTLKISVLKCSNLVTPSGKFQKQTRPIGHVVKEISYWCKAWTQVASLNLRKSESLHTFIPIKALLISSCINICFTPLNLIIKHCLINPKTHLYMVICTKSQDSSYYIILDCKSHSFNKYCMPTMYHKLH